MVKNVKFFSLISIIIFAIVTFITIVIAKKEAVPVKISNFTEIQDFYSFSPDYNDISVMKNNKICFTTQGKLYIYDLTNHTLSDKVLLSEDSNGIHFTNWIKLLSNENILIMQNKEIFSNPFNYEDSSTLIEIYSPKEKKIIFEKKIPRTFNWNYAVAELPENKLIFLGSMYKNLKECLILDIANNKIERGIDLIKERNSANVISIDKERVFVFGGITSDNYPDDFAEIFNSQKNTFTKIPLNFNVAPGINNIRLSKLSDGRILILCERAYETPRKTGKKEGASYPDGRMITIYPETYLTVFNPKDNSFEEIDINKGQTELRSEYDALVLSDDRILITGGYDVSTKSSKATTNILIYDIKTKKLNRVSQKFKYTHAGTNMSYLLNDGSVLVSGWNIHFPLLDNKVEKINFK